MTKINEVFRVEGTRIIAPDGKEFIQKGTNINGLNCWWDREVTQDVNLIADVWKFNTVRANCVIKPERFYKGGTGKNINNDIDKIVRTFTEHKVVVQLEAHDWTGLYPTEDSDPSLEVLQDWYKELAEKYKDNTYVWFNIMNEPGTGSLNPIWKPVHEAAIKTIRDAGANNIIVLDGHGFASELGDSGAEMVAEKDSAILSYGQELAENYGNIVFSVHMYGWTGPKAKFEDFVDKVHAKGLALMIGEFGSIKDKGQLTSSVETVKTTLQVAADRKLGWLHWAWQGADGFCLTDEYTRQGGGWEIDSQNGEKPSNLSWMGEKLWNDSHDILQSFDDIDLAIRDIAFNKHHFEVGDELQFQVVLKNFGDKKISSQARGKVKFYVDDREIGEAEFKGPFGLQKCKTLLSPLFKADREEFTVSAVIDNNSSYGKDVNLGNNSKCLRVTRAVFSGQTDLSIAKLSILPEKEIYNCGDRVNFAVEIKNNGNSTLNYNLLGGIFLVNGDKVARAEKQAVLMPGDCIALITDRQYEIKGCFDLSFRLYDDQHTWTLKDSQFNEILFKTIKVSTPSEPVNLVTNGDFEQGLEGWSIWGGKHKAAEDEHNGTKAWKIEGGSSGGGGQNLALEPSTAYKLSARVKNEGDVGVKYQLTDGSWVQNKLTFSSEEYSYKEIQFIVPEDFREPTLFVWKGRKDSDLYIDSIRLVEV